MFDIKEYLPKNKEEALKAAGAISAIGLCGLGVEKLTEVLDNYSFEVVHNLRTPDPAHEALLTSLFFIPALPFIYEGARKFLKRY